MTDQTTPTFTGHPELTDADHADLEEAAANPAAPWNAPDSGDDDSSDDDQPDRAARQAARYRTQLRAVEAERDAMAARLAAHDQHQAQQVAAEILTNPGDFMLVHPNLDEFRTDDGSLDSERVKAAAEKIAEDRPHWRKVVQTPPPSRRPTEGFRGGATPAPEQPVGASWDQLIQGRR